VSLSETVVRYLDWINIFAYFSVVIGLVALMALAGIPPMIAAVRLFMGIGIVLSVIFFITMWRTHQFQNIRALSAPFLKLIDNFATMTTELTLLLATLSILTGAFVITGVPPKVGFLLMEAAGVNLVAMILVGFVFGAIVGTGLPPAPTYIITALVIAPPMIKVGVDPWVVHFFAFFLAVWGELTPPTSVVAAVTAKIANASFMGTLFRAISLCIGLFVLIGAIFAKPQLVVEPGVGQLIAFGLVLMGTIGLAFSFQATFSDNRKSDLVARVVLACISIVVILHPNILTAAVVAIPVAAFVVYWLFKRRRQAVLG
jgi:TRAP-type uncharacterized transport system fused permease subunit